MKKIGGVFLSILAFFSSALNVFADAVEVYEEKTETINKEDYEKYKETVEKKVLELNETDGEYVYDYEVIIKEEKDEVIITEKEIISSTEKFTSEEDAKKYYDEYKLEDSWKKGELKISSNDESVTVSGKEVTISCKEATCAEEIEALEASLNQYQKLEILGKETTSKDDTKKVIYSINGEEQELTAEEAAKIVLTVKPQIEGYTFIKNEAFLTRKGSADIKTYQDLYGNVTFEEKAEAEKALAEFLARTDYENITGIIAAYPDANETVVEKYSTKGHLTKELAEQAALREIEISATGSTIIISEAYEKEINEVEEINKKEFATNAGAAQFLAEKLAAGFVATNIKYETIEGEINGTIETGVKVTPQKYLPLTSSTLSDYIIIKKGNKAVAVWTKDVEWSNKQKENFINSISKVDTSINSNTKIEFIHGYKTFDLSYLSNEWGTEYKFTNNSGIITVTPKEKNDISYIVTGTVKYTDSKVLLSCTLTKQSKLWYVDLQKTTIGYDFAIVGGASTITRDLFKVQSILTGKIYNHTMTYKINTTNAYTSYVASFDIYKEATKTNATVAYKITREKAATGTTGPSTDEETPEVETKPEEDVALPPNTGVEVNFFLEGALLISILVAAISLKKLCK